MSFQVDFAWSMALRLLASGNLTKNELINKLKFKFDEKTVLECIQKLQDFDVLEEKRYARFFAEKLARDKFFSDSRIKLEMKIKDFQEEFIEDAIYEIYIKESDRIKSFLVKKCRGDSKMEKQRMLRSLKKLGYSFGIIKEVLNEN
jgi:SOS response regulatory protein OraA/RecX